MDAQAAATMIRGVQNAFQFLTVLHLTDHFFSPQADVESCPYYDFIVVGGGTAGCVLASRLAEDGKSQVLLIEAGGVPPIQSRLPGLLVYIKNSSVDWRYIAQDTSKKNSPEILAIGKVLGGSSISNYLIYSEGGKKDYDKWATIVNNSNWNGESVLPYFIKSQNLDDSIIENSPDGQYYGRDGPITLTKSRSQTVQDYLMAFKEAGFTIRDDTNIENPIGFGPALFNLGNGVRQDTAINYLGPQKDSPNLHILRNAMATKIIFDKSNRAVAVEVCLNGKSIRIYAKLEIIVSCGALNTPKLLMLSGIGPKKELESNGIKVIADLPVGKNLQYQSSTVLVFSLKNTQGKPPPLDPGVYPADVVTGYAALNPKSKQPDYLAINYINYASQLTLYSEITYQFPDNVTNDLFSPCGKYRSSDKYQIMFTVISDLNMKTRGEVTLQSTNIKDQPNINVSKYYVSSDLDNQVKYVKDFIKIMDTPTFKKFGAEFLAPELEECDKFEKFSSDYWYCYVEYMASLRPLFGGTTSLGSVVDDSLRVKKVMGLRVVDAGIMPVLPRAVLLGPTVMIAEKAADIIKEENGLDN